MQLTMSSSQHVLNGSSSARLAIAKAAGGLAERIASSQFCSSSNEINEGFLWHFSLCNNSQVRTARRRAVAPAADGFKQKMDGCWIRGRRAQRAPPAAGREQQQPYSENWDVGDFKIDNVGLDDVGGDASMDNDMGLADYLPSRLVDDSSERSAAFHSADANGAAENHAPESEPSSPASSFWFDRISKRWTIVILCFFAFLLCNMDRVNMSIAIMPMAAEYHWNSTTVGLVQSSFFWGYLLTQVLSNLAFHCFLPTASHQVSILKSRPSTRWADCGGWAHEGEHE